MNQSSFKKEKESKSQFHPESDLEERGEEETNNSKELAKWIDNQGNEVEQVFGFNENAELVNGRAAMFGFLMLLLTELAYGGIPATKGLFGLG